MANIYLRNRSKQFSISQKIKLTFVLVGVFVPICQFDSQTLFLYIASW